MVEAFQANKLDVIVCATVAAKEGITPPSADTVLLLRENGLLHGKSKQKIESIVSVKNHNQYTQSISRWLRPLTRSSTML